MMQITYRTEDATLKANGAWYVVDEETRRTDCVARAVGPSLELCVNPSKD